MPRSSLVEHFLLPISLVMRGRGVVLDYISEFREHAAWEPGTLEEYAALKRENLLRRIMDEVPFYRKLSASLPSVSEMARDHEAWSKLPVVDKEIIGKDRSAFTSSTVRNPIWTSTSGSSGVKFEFLVDNESTKYAEAAKLVSNEMMGMSLCPRTLLLWGSPRDMAALTGRALASLRLRLLNTRVILAYSMNDDRAAVILEEIERFRPELLISYPNVLHDLVKRDKRGVLSSDAVGRFVSAGEWLRPDVKYAIESTTGKIVLDRYGSREYGIIAQECAEGRGLHVMTDQVHLEVVRPDMSPCSLGEEGEFLLTVLNRWTMPFLRYRIGDRGEMSGHMCSCGSPYPLLGSLRGRTMDLVHCSDGTTISGFFWTHIAREVQGIERFRIIQPEDGVVEIEVILEEGAPENAISDFQEEIARKLNGKLVVEVRAVECMPTTTSGKLKFIERRAGS